MTPLYNAIRFKRPEVIKLLIEKFEADLELEIFGGKTALFTAVCYLPAAVKLLLEHGACVNHRDRRGRTPLMAAVEAVYYGDCLAAFERVELLLSYGADVNAVTYFNTCDDYIYNYLHGASPLHTALHVYRRVRDDDDDMTATRRAQVNKCLFDVIQLLVPHCSSLDVRVAYNESCTTVPGATICFTAEYKQQPDLRVTKYLLQNGATTAFREFYATVKYQDDSNADLITASFVRLCFLSGCTFSEYFIELKEEKEQGPAGQDHRAKHVHALVKDLFSQPLTLQELSIMTTRKRIGSQNLWAKIDALPVGLPRHVKDMIQLKTY